MKLISIITFTLLLNNLIAQKKTAEPVKVGVFKIGQKAGDTWSNSKGMVFCWCPPGQFEMNGKKVEIKDGFWIGKYEVTKGQWTGSGINRKSITKDKDEPVVFVNEQKDILARAIGGINKLEVGKYIPKDWEYSLPTSEQWEYAARAGTSTKFYFGNDVNKLPEHANFADKAFYDSKDIFSNYAHRVLNDGTVRLAKVGQYKANPWGLHDVYGNAAEFCHGAIFRGGSWLSVAEKCNSEFIDQVHNRFASNYIGCRFIIRKKGSIPNQKKK